VLEALPRTVDQRRDDLQRRAGREHDLVEQRTRRTERAVDRGDDHHPTTSRGSELDGALDHRPVDSDDTLPRRPADLLGDAAERGAGADDDLRLDQLGQAIGDRAQHPDIALAESSRLVEHDLVDDLDHVRTGQQLLDEVAEGRRVLPRRV